MENIYFSHKTFAFLQDTFCREPLRFVLVFQASTVELQNMLELC